MKCGAKVGVCELAPEHDKPHRANGLAVPYDMTVEDSAEVARMLKSSGFGGNK